MVSGPFAGESRSVEFRDGGVSGVPVIEFSGWDDYGLYLYRKRHLIGILSGVVLEKFSSSSVSSPYPLQFCLKKISPSAGRNMESTFQVGNRGEIHRISLLNKGYRHKRYHRQWHNGLYRI